MPRGTRCTIYKEANMSCSAVSPETSLPPSPDVRPGGARIIRLPEAPVRVAPPRAAPLIVQARIHLEGRRRFIAAGTAALAVGHGGRRLLCIRVEAMPADRRLYVPLQDVLVLAAESSVLDFSEAARGHA